MDYKAVEEHWREVDAGIWRENDKKVIMQFLSLISQALIDIAESLHGIKVPKEIEHTYGIIEK